MAAESETSSEASEMEIEIEEIPKTVVSDKKSLHSAIKSAKSLSHRSTASKPMKSLGGAKITNAFMFETQTVASKETQAERAAEVKKEGKLR